MVVAGRTVIRRRLIVSVLVGLLVPLLADAANFTKGKEVAPFPEEFKPGDYIWHPEISPAGPVVLVISLPDQQLYVFRNGVRIGRSTVSTGTKKNQTPTGVFTILQRKVDHESSIYKGAKMPHMQRLTWDGIAIHAGRLPGYPASHGCVRVPVDFAEKLYSVTTIGTTVIIADDKSAPSTTTNPGMLFAGTEGAAAPAGPVVWQPEKAPEGPVSIVISAADGAAYIYRNGVEIGRAPVGGLERRLRLACVLGLGEGRRAGTARLAVGHQRRRRGAGSEGAGGPDDGRPRDPRQHARVDRAGHVADRHGCAGERRHPRHDPIMRLPHRCIVAGFIRA